MSATRLFTKEEIMEALNEWTGGIPLDVWVNENLAYPVFNPEEMRKTLIEKKRLDLIPVCIVVGLVKGNNIDKIRRNLRGEIATELQNAVIKFRIKATPSRDVKAVTLSRIITCFPEVALPTVHKYNIPMAIDDQLKNIHTEYPKVAKHEVCVTTIPASLGTESTKAFDIILIPYLLKSDIFRAKNSSWINKSNLTKASELSRYLFSLYRKQLITPEKRNILASQIGMVDAENGLSSTWTSVAESAKEYLKEKYDYSCTEDLTILSSLQ